MPNSDCIVAKKKAPVDIQKAVSNGTNEVRSLGPLNEKWRTRIRNVLDKWSRLEQTDNPIEEWRTHSALSRDLKQQLDTLQQNKDPGDLDSQQLRNIYAVLGSTQSLLDAMKELGESMQQINWDQWAVDRF